MLNETNPLKKSFNMAKISIIIPVYNAEKYLERTIRSVISQSFEDIELILVDDGSSDSSLSICESFSKYDERILVLTQSNMGVSSARNKGLKFAKGQWVYFLDSNDTLESNCFEECSKYFDLDADVIQFSSRRIRDQEVESYRQTLKEGKIRITEGLNEFMDVSNIGALCVWLHLIKTDVIVSNKISFSEDMNYNEDMLFMYTVMMYSKRQVFIGHLLHNQYLVENSLSRSPVTRIKIENRLLLVKRVFELTKINSLYKSRFKLEGNKLLKWYFVSLLNFRDEYRVNIKEFNDDYKFFYDECCPFIDTYFSKIARLDIRFVIAALEMKLFLRKLIANFFNNTPS